MRSTWPLVSLLAVVLCPRGSVGVSMKNLGSNLSGVLSRKGVAPLPKSASSAPSGLTASSLPSISSFTPPVSAVCVNQSLSCCRRQLTAYQQHLDLLDSEIQDNSTTSATECVTKMDVFLLSTGVDDIDAFRDLNILFEPDCVHDGPWTPIRDVDGEGTIMTAMLSWPYGLTRNAIIHSVKIGETYATTTVSSFLCGINRVRSWLVANPCKRAIVVETQFLLQTHPVDFNDPISVAVRALIGEFGDRIVFICNPEELTIQEGPASVLYYTPPGNVPEVLGVSIDWLGFFHIANISGPSTDIWVLTGFVVSPYLGNTIEVTNFTDVANALAAAVLVEYWLTHPQLTGNELREMIERNGESDIHVTGGVTEPVPGIINKRLTYRCTTGCEPCKNGGILIDDALVLKPGRALCACPPETTGATCETLTCPTGCTSPHPGDCDKYVVCIDGRPVTTKCGVRDGVQLLYDTLTERCVPPCEAAVRPGCTYPCLGSERSHVCY